jgi:hypothetical protein
MSSYSQEEFDEEGKRKISNTRLGDIDIDGVSQG